LRPTFLAAFLFFILIGSLVGLTVNSNIQVSKYLDLIGRMDDAYRHFMDDLCGMMDLALKFKDDPGYDYDPSDMERVVMRDDVNGTQELIEVYNELLNTTLNDVKSLQKELNYTNG